MLKDTPSVKAVTKEEVKDHRCENARKRPQHELDSVTKKLI
jgi:hypothetical protein